MVERESAEKLRRVLEDLTSREDEPRVKARELEEFARALLRRVESLETAGRMVREDHEFLWDFVRKVSTLKDPYELLDDIADLLIKELRVGRCTIFLRHCDGKRLVFQTGRGVEEEIREVSIPIGKGVAGYVARTGKPLLVPDIDEDPRFERREEPGYRTKSFLCAPLLAEGEVVGVINVSEKEDGSGFTANDLRLLAGLGKAAGRAYQNALHHSETEESGIFIANVMESLNLGLLVVDPDRRVRLANTEFLRLFGLERESVRGRLCYSTVGTYLAEPLNRLLDRAWEQGNDQQVRLLWEMENGDSIPLQVGVTLFRNRQSDIIGTLITFNDLSESPELEEVRKLEKIKSNFVSTVSHELRTPLASMIGSISLLRSGMAGEVTGQQTRLLDILHRNSYRLKELIEDILDLSRLESAEASLICEDTNLRDLAEEAAAGTREAAQRKKMDLTLDESLDLRVQVDPKKIQQALLNLIGNAIKFTPPEGKVRVSAAREDDSVTVFVQDTGIGISEEEREKVFEKFYQVEDALVRTNQGSGLGLAICRHIVEMHGGEIGVRSAPGGGSIFWFRIPLRAESTARSQNHDEGALPSVKS